MAQPVPVVIDTAEKLDEALTYWKNTTFSQHYLKLSDVVESLKQPSGHLVDARQEYAARWLLCLPGGKKPATLWTAGVWRWNSDLETGNFVPPGETAPARLPESRIQTMPNNLCRFTYVVDTTHDKSLWEAQNVFERYMDKVNKFNTVKKEHPNRHTRAKEASRAYPLHDWIKNATKKGMPYFANDEKPVFFEPDEAGGLRPLSEAFPPMLKVGDLVWMSFSVEFFIGNKFWSTNFIPYEFVRVGSVALKLLPEIKTEFVEDEEEGPRERLGVGMRGISALEARQPGAGGGSPPVPPPDHPEPMTTDQLGAGGGLPPVLPPNHPEPMTKKAVINETARLMEDLEQFRKLRHAELERARTPRAFIDTESEEGTGYTTGDVTDEEEIRCGVQPDDDETMTQDYMSAGDDSFIDDDSPLSDDAASMTEDAASMTEDAGSVSDDTSGQGGDPSAKDTTTDSVVMQASSPFSSGKLLNQLAIRGAVNVAGPRAAEQPSPKPRGKKCTASSERPPLDAVVVGGMVLCKRTAKGKGAGL